MCKENKIQLHLKFHSTSLEDLKNLARREKRVVSRQVEAIVEAHLEGLRSENHAENQQTPAKPEWDVAVAKRSE